MIESLRLYAGGSVLRCVSERLRCGSKRVGEQARIAAACAACLLLVACTPQTALVASVLQEPMIALLGQLERVDDRNLRRVLEHERAGRWEELARLATQHIAKDPANADWWLVKGYALERLGQAARAAEAYGEAVRLEPDQAAGWHLLAQAHRSAGEPRRAVAVLNQALLAARDPTATYFLLGESYRDLERYEDAARAYGEALARERRFAPAWFGLSQAQAKLGRTAEARTARAELERLDPTLAARLP
jgi:tetratricopeptide (TPR) repeat protein